jgi:alkylation response protein AidB-like acyl-CoA dehydrogenase
MSLKKQSAAPLTLASNNSDGTTGPGDVSNDRSVFAAGETSSRLLADIRRMAPMIAKRAAEIEAARRIPLDLVATLKSIGVFRMLAPKSHGGLELELSGALKILAALAKIDGSLGWAAMVGSGSSLLASSLPRETYDQIYRDGPDVIFAGSRQPAGTGEAVDGGLRVNGRWPFASGCQHADWIFAACVMTKDGQPLPGRIDGVPMIRFVFLPATYCQIEDTWHAAGLKGTGSHHVVLRDTLVPVANSSDPSSDISCLPGPLYNAPLPFIPLFHAAIALGIAEGALEDLAELAGTGRRQTRAVRAMRDSEVFQYELGCAQALFRAARSYLETQTASHWSHARAGILRDGALMAEGTQAGVWITNACLRVAEMCFALGGGSAVYEDSMLQRRLRDLHVAAQHASVQQRHYVDAGKLFISMTSDG